MRVLVEFRRGLVRAGGQARLAAALREPVREALERAGLLALFGSPEEVGERHAGRAKECVVSPHENREVNHESDTEHP
jgi:hypothetical protein